VRRWRLSRRPCHLGVTIVTNTRTRTWLAALAALLLGLLVVVLLAPAASVQTASAKPPKPTPTPSATSLASFATDPSPWLHLEANSLQPSPLYLGATPRELALGLPAAAGTTATLPLSLRALGDAQLKNIRQTLISKKVVSAKATLTVECWPIREYRGRLTWLFARWRTSSTDPWHWIDSSLIANTEPNPNAYVPEPLDPTVASDRQDLFGAPDDWDYGWYYTPQFSSCIWVKKVADMSVASVIEAWLPSSLLETYEQKDLSDRIALVTPPPARLNGKPVTYPVVTVKSTGTTWPSSLTWVADDLSIPEPLDEGPIITDWPADLAQKYHDDLLSMDGEMPAIFPVTRRVVSFTCKNNALPYNQLEQNFQYLEERYQIMGIATQRQSFFWRGMPQTNLIAVIPGSDPRLAPVLMADHIDTAFDEDEIVNFHNVIAVPGADDNSSASAALLRAAEVLKDRHPVRTIKLVHFTGEEFPADDLGARQLVSEMLGDRQDIAGLVLLDMIGFSGVGENQFQISPGQHAPSIEIGRIALDAAADQAPDLTPLYEPRYSTRSYLYNTDGIIFSENGYPVILINEHLNYYTRLMRAAYHDMGDTSDKVNFPFAVKLTKVSIETVARLADVPAQ
jgi:Peptidase family M28